MIPLVSPTITRRDQDAMEEAIPYGVLEDEKFVRRFEEAFAERVGCAGAVAVCSGTEALALGLAVAHHDVSVRLPSYSCSAVLNAAELHERRLIDGSFDVRTAAMTQGHADVIVHMFGTSTKGGPAPLEDWTLSLGGVGALLGKVGVCSTHASKMISTGRGGVVFSNDQPRLDEVRQLAYYDSEPNGRLGAYSVGMSSMQAALGLSQLAQLDAFIERRREIAAAYSAAFEPAGIECPGPDCGSVFFRYLIGVEDPAAKVAGLAEHGIEAGRGVYPPLHRQLGLPDEQFPGATACVNRLLSVPCHPSLTDAQVEFVAEKVLEVCA